MLCCPRPSYCVLLNHFADAIGSHTNCHRPSAPCNASLAKLVPCELSFVRSALTTATACTDGVTSWGMRDVEIRSINSWRPRPASSPVSIADTNDMHLEGIGQTRDPQIDHISASAVTKWSRERGAAHISTSISAWKGTRLHASRLKSKLVLLIGCESAQLIVTAACIA